MRTRKNIKQTQDQLFSHYNDFISILQEVDTESLKIVSVEPSIKQLQSKIGALLTMIKGKELSPPQKAQL